MQNQVQVELAASEAAAPEVEAGRAFAQMTRMDADAAAASLNAGLAAVTAAADHLQNRLHVKVWLIHMIGPI